MFAAHLAAGLALKQTAPKAPTWAFLTGAFLPDFAWIVLAGLDIEPADPAHYFDGWSHSLLSTAIMATAYALVFRSFGRRAQFALWAAVASHYLLDAPIHPAPLELWPHATIASAWNLWPWGKERSAIGLTHYAMVQGVITFVLLATYATAARSRGVSRRLVVASCVAVSGLWLLI
jgi:membrane-bound metal-dependent hydrolase YbcI (DUF457 family)